jgi:hypothetical protein
MTGNLSDEERQIAAIGELLHRIWSCRLQLERLIESTHLEWSGGVEFDSLEQGRRFSRTSYDEHLVLVAGRHLVVAVEIVGSICPQFHFDPKMARQLTLMRNIHEHWDDPLSGRRLKSLEKFEQEFPSARARSISYSPTDWIIGDVISMGEISKVLDNLESAALPMSRWADDE